MTEESLFEQAVNLPPAERAALLDRECAGNPELRQRVEALLAADAKSNLTVDSPVDATESYVAPGESAGAVIAGRYTLVELIGEGGMGEVWVAKQSEPVKRKVALKLIKAGMDTKAVLQRFEAERQALALMDHPNIAKVLDGGMTAERRPFFVMDLVNGLPLNKFCDDAKLDIRERLELFVSICQAVQHAHQKGIIHRDLKPSNILVTFLDGKPIPKIIDFGVAKAVGGRLTDESLSTQFGAVVGTLEYMSPEQAGYSAADVDTRADIYSLGVILYELLTGLKPIDATRLRQAAMTEMIRIIKEEEPSKPSTRLSTDDAAPSLAALRHTEPKKLAALLRGELDWVVMKCLEKQRDRRYETANGLARDIQRYLADEAVEARPPSSGYRLRMFLRRNKGPVIAASLVLMSLIAGIVGTSAGLFRARNAEHQAIKQRDAKDKALKEAEEQSAVATAVNRFLQNDLLQQADSYKQAERSFASDPDIKVAALVDRAAQSIEGKFKGRPQVEAALRLTIGDAYRALGRLTDAQFHLERSVELRASHLGGNHLDTLTSKSSLALVYHEQFKSEKAVTLLKDVIDQRAAILGPDHPDTLSSKHNLAELYVARGPLDRAKQLCLDVLQTRTTLCGAQHLDTLRSRHLLAGVYIGEKRLDEAEIVLREVVEAQTNQLGTDHPDTLTSKHTLSVVYWFRKNYDLAECLFHEVLRDAAPRLGEDHLDILMCKHNLAEMYNDQGKFRQAEPLSVAAVIGARRKLGVGHANTRSFMSNLIDCYERSGEPAKAEPMLRELLDYWKQFGSADSLKHLAQLDALGSNLLRQARFNEAEAAARECLTIRMEKQPDGWRTFDTMSLLGGALLGQKRYADAEPLLVTGFEGMKKRVAQIAPHSRPRFLEGAERLVQLYEALGKKDEAAKWELELEAIKGR
jgi:serine/threonine protein kinase